MEEIGKKEGAKKGGNREKWKQGRANEDHDRLNQLSKMIDRFQLLRLVLLFFIENT